MLNTTTQSPFSHKVTVDLPALPPAPQPPKATGLMRDTWEARPQPELIIPTAPAPAWLDTLLGYVSSAVPMMQGAIATWKTVPRVLQDAGNVAQGLWGVAQNVWASITGWFAPAAPAPAPVVPVLAAPVTPAPVEVPTVSAEQLAEQERSIRRRVRIVMKRDATAAEVAEYQKRLAEGATMDDVHQALQAKPEAQIAKAFLEVVGRDIDDRGRAFWMNEYHNGESIDDIRARLRAFMHK